MTKVEFHPEAQTELENASNWYRERSDLAARAFTQEVVHALKRIAESPESWPQTRANERVFFSEDFLIQSSIASARMKYSSRRLLITGGAPVIGNVVAKTA